MLIVLVQFQNHSDSWYTGYIWPISWAEFMVVQFNFYICSSLHDWIGNRLHAHGYCSERYSLDQKFNIQCFVCFSSRDLIMFSLRFVCPSVRVSVCPSVRVSVCPSVFKITQKLLDGFSWNFGQHVGIVKRKRWQDFSNDAEWTMESGSVIPKLHIFNVPYFKAQWTYDVESLIAY